MRVRGICGSLSGTPLTRTSKRMVVLADKKENPRECLGDGTIGLATVRKRPVGATQKA